MVTALAELEQWPGGLFQRHPCRPGFFAHLALNRYLNLSRGNGPYRNPTDPRGFPLLRWVRDLTDVGAAGVGFYRRAMKRDWVAVVVIVTEIVILLVAAAAVYAAFHSY